LVSVLETFGCHVKTTIPPCTKRADHSMTLPSLATLGDPRTGSSQVGTLKPRPCSNQIGSGSPLIIGGPECAVTQEPSIVC